MNETEPIIKLELILNEFYHQSTSNFRKKEIERDLRVFQENPESWKIIIRILENSSSFNNQYLWFFSISTIELCVTKKWNSLDLKSRTYIRDFLWLVYCNFSPNIGAMQRDKIAQIISLIGKRQFPDENPEFLLQILNLIKSKFILGITLLKSTFAEIISTKPDVTYQKKRNFIQGMTLGLREIFPLLNKFLTLCVCRVSNNELIFGSSDEFLNTSLPNDDKFIYCCTELLVCISSIFSWTPTNDTNMTSEFFNNIFELCMFSGEKYVSVNIAALMTISELFYLQKPLPQPQIQANGITELLQQHTLSQSLDEYQDKLTELIKLFITQQWGRCVNSKDFPSKEFLLYLFNFTFCGGISALTFTERLSIWKPIIQSFNEKSAGRYTETILQLISNVFKKMQFQCYSELDLLDTEELDENMQTELQTFLNQCIEIISTAAEVEPLKIFDLVNNEFNRDDGKFKIFLAFANSLPDFTKENTKIPINIDNLLRCFTNETSKAFFFHCLIRDLSTILQTITQLSSIVLLTTDERSHSISIVIRSCLYALKVSNKKKLYLYNFGNHQSITTDLIELQAQIITSVRSLLLLRNDVLENYDEMYGLIGSVAQILLPSPFGIDEPLVVINSSAQLMLTITSGVRPHYILKHPTVMEILQSDLSHHADKHVRLSIKKIVFNCLLLPYNKIAINLIEEQDFEKRSQFLQQYISFISNKFLMMDLNIEDPMILEQTKTELGDYEELLEVFGDTNTISKQMLLGGMQKIINKSIELFQKFGKNPLIYEEIVNFFLGVIKCLQLQLGSDFVIQVIKMILDMSSISNKNSHPMNKLLQMLTFIVQQSGSAANMLMCDIMKLTLDELFPLERAQTIDISTNFYTLLDAILQNHWNYFHKNPINSTRNNQEDLLKMFTAYGQFLCNGANSQDPNVIRIILSSLEKLNELWHLYDKVFFKDFLLKSFLCTLIRLVISAAGVLFYDQIISMIYRMSEKSKTILQESFISVGYPPEVKIIQQICEACDLPTFSNQMEILIQDTIYSQFLQ
ncbi:CLUMA_CG006556, isoform A [Clunio marinus]|uniref:CLUMA_CG006556, isoform A n=1 Tax=Clunio marinus TaxID=568069 RepID=A0A1J1HYI9_9DIPT|nr:CLUMA_CG006556, isoform A [Clunio marinus]